MNRYTQIIVDEARRRAIDVDVLDDATGEMVLRFGGRDVHTIQSLSELTSAVALRRCDDKVLTREVLTRAGLRVPRGRPATFDERDAALLDELGDVVVKPARGEGGAGVTVGVTDRQALSEAIDAAGALCPEVLIEERSDGLDLRIVVIDGAVVAASVRRPPTIVGDGRRTVAELVAALDVERSAATDGAARVPLDATTRGVLADAGIGPDDVLADGRAVPVRRTANVHTGGTIDDVTDELHPTLAEVAIATAEALRIPLVGVDLMVAAVDRPDYVIIEANEQPGLANHEPRPTAERFIDLLFPETIG